MMDRGIISFQEPLMKYWHSSHQRGVSCCLAALLWLVRPFLAASLLWFLSVVRLLEALFLYLFFFSITPFFTLSVSLAFYFLSFSCYILLFRCFPFHLIFLYLCSFLFHHFLLKMSYLLPFCISVIVSISSSPIPFSALFLLISPLIFSSFYFLSATLNFVSFSLYISCFFCFILFFLLYFIPLLYLLLYANFFLRSSFFFWS